MTGFPVLAVGILMNLVAVVFVLMSIILILVVLIQKGKGGGLSAAFGGGMASGLLGSKTGDFLTWATITVVGIYLVLAVLLARFYKPGTGEFGVPETPTKSAQPASGAPAGESVPEAPAPTEQPAGQGTVPVEQPAPQGAAPAAQPSAPSPGAGAAPTPTPEANSTGG